MMTNIPCHLEVDDLALIIEEAGFQDCYDVLYLPKRGGSLHNMGFAVLNFNTTTLRANSNAAFHMVGPYLRQVSMASPKS